MGKIEYTFDAVNQRLKAGHVRVAIRQRGSSLSMVATLPPKPGDNRPKPYQQIITLGVPANENGFKRAEDEARRLGAALALKEFDWRLYIEAESDRNLAAAVIARFKAQYMATHTLSEATWKGHWNDVYGRLPQGKPLEVATLLEVAYATPRNSRNRLQTCKKLQKLADFAGLKVDLLQYQGNYGNSQVVRTIPSDEEIVYWRSQLHSPEWQWVYGMMAAFGLRNHESFFCEFVSDGLHVVKGKTGPRMVFVGLYPEWVEQWDLRNVKRPNLALDKDFGYLGDRTCKAFKRHKIPFTPYDLRHAWAIRASVRFRYPIPTSAALMGHSPEIHLKTCQRHINEGVHRETTRNIMSNPDRPKPPDASPDRL